MSVPSIRAASIFLHFYCYQSFHSLLPLLTVHLSSSFHHPPSANPHRLSTPPRLLATRPPTANSLPTIPRHQTNADSLFARNRVQSCWLRIIARSLSFLSDIFFLIRSRFLNGLFPFAASSNGRIHVILVALTDTQLDAHHTRQILDKRLGPRAAICRATPSNSPESQIF